MFPKQEQGITQKNQSHRFLAKPKMIVAGGLGGGVSHPGGPSESACVNPPPLPPPKKNMFFLS